jgi:hypothetical protein
MIVSGLIVILTRAFARRPFFVLSSIAAWNILGHCRRRHAPKEI